MRSRAFAAALVVLLMTVACGSTSESPEAAAPSPTAPGEALAEEPTDDGKSGEGSSREDEDKDKGSAASDKASGGKGDAGDNGEPGGAPSGSDDGAGPDTSSGDGSDSTRGDGADAPEGGPSPTGDGNRSGTAARRSPRAGDYVYNQSGYEKFCAGGCDTQKLPPSQTVKTSIPSSSASADVVVTEARSSGGRMARTTSRYSQGAAHITEVYVRFAYSGYTFDQTYRPQPAVQSLRFPLREGAAWNGSWKGKVSGSYSVSVVGREAVSAAGSNVEAIKVETKTSFRGDFSGKAHATMWIDPRTRAVLRTAGNLHVASTYGSYETGFATSLRSGPGY